MTEPTTGSTTEAAPPTQGPGATSELSASAEVVLCDVRDEALSVDEVLGLVDVFLLAGAGGVLIFLSESIPNQPV